MRTLSRARAHSSTLTLKHMCVCRQVDMDVCMCMCVWAEALPSIYPPSPSVLIGEKRGSFQNEQLFLFSQILYSSSFMRNNESIRSPFPFTHLFPVRMRKEGDECILTGTGSFVDPTPPIPSSPFAPARLSLNDPLHLCTLAASIDARLSD